MKRSICMLGVFSLTLFGCGGGGSDSTSSTLPADTPPALEEKSSLTINGIATDAPLAGATVTLLFDGQETDYSATTDNTGNYSIELEYQESDLTQFISIKAMGTGSQSTAGLISLVGELKELVNDAGDDNTLVSSENFGVTVSHITTAKYGLMVQANGSESVHSKSIVEQLSQQISQQDVLTLATAIKVAIDKAAANPDLALPPGFDDTLELMRYSGVMDEYVDLVLLTQEFEEAQKETLNDPAIYDSSLTFPTSFELFFTDLNANQSSNHAFKFNADGTGKYQESMFMWEHSGSRIDITFAQETYDESFIYEGDPQVSVRQLKGIKNIILRIVSETEDSLGLAVDYTTEILYPDNADKETEVVEHSEFVMATMETYLISFATPTSLHLPFADLGSQLGLKLDSDALDLEVKADKFSFNPDGTAIGEITGITVNWMFEDNALKLEFLDSTRAWTSDYAFPFTSMKMRKVSNGSFADKVQVNLVDADGVEAFANVYLANLSEKVIEWSVESAPGIYAYRYGISESELNQFYFILHENGDADTISTKDENGDGELSEDEVIRNFGQWKVENGKLVVTRTKLRFGVDDPQCRAPGYLDNQDECLLYHERSWELLNRDGDAFYLFHSHHFYYKNLFGDEGWSIPDLEIWDLRTLYKMDNEPVDLSHLSTDGVSQPTSSPGLL